MLQQKYAMMRQKKTGLSENFVPLSYCIVSFRTFGHMRDSLRKSKTKAFEYSSQRSLFFVNGPVK